jgi:phosphatidate cytidylyltransferase
MLKREIKVKTKALIGWFVLGAGWMFLSRLRFLYGTEITMYFLLLIWTADIAAYFVGKKFGKIKFAPEISPGKTVAGVYGAMASSLLCVFGLGIYFYFAYDDLPYLVLMHFVLLSALTVQISIYGDLFISMLKRQRGIKDSGGLLPGHGGILDRVDSIIAGIPIYYAGVFVIYRLIE